MTCSFYTNDTRLASEINPQNSPQQSLPIPSFSLPYPTRIFQPRNSYTVAPLSHESVKICRVLITRLLFLLFLANIFLQLCKHAWFHRMFLWPKHTFFLVEDFSSKLPWYCLFALKLLTDFQLISPLWQCVIFNLSLY